MSNELNNNNNNNRIQIDFIDNANGLNTQQNVENFQLIKTTDTTSINPNSTIACFFEQVNNKKIEIQQNSSLKKIKGLRKGNPLRHLCLAGMNSIDLQKQNENKDACCDNRDISSTTYTTLSSCLTNSTVKDKLLLHNQIAQDNQYTKNQGLNDKEIKFDDRSTLSGIITEINHNDHLDLVREEKTKVLPSNNFCISPSDKISLTNLNDELLDQRSSKSTLVVQESSDSPLTKQVIKGMLEQAGNYTLTGRSNETTYNFDDKGTFFNIPKIITSPCQYKQTDRKIPKSYSNSEVGSISTPTACAGIEIDQAGMLSNKNAKSYPRRNSFQQKQEDKENKKGPDVINEISPKSDLFKSLSPAKASERLDNQIKELNNQADKKFILPLNKTEILLSSEELLKHIKDDEILFQVENICIAEFNSQELKTSSFSDRNISIDGNTQRQQVENKISTSISPNSQQSAKKKMLKKPAFISISKVDFNRAIMKFFLERCDTGDQKGLTKNASENNEVKKPSNHNNVHGQDHKFVNYSISKGGSPGKILERIIKQKEFDYGNPPETKFESPSSTIQVIMESYNTDYSAERARGFSTSKNQSNKDGDSRGIENQPIMVNISNSYDHSSSNMKLNMNQMVIQNKNNLGGDKSSGVDARDVNANASPSGNHHDGRSKSNIGCDNNVHDDSDFANDIIIQRIKERLIQVKQKNLMMMKVKDVQNDINNSIHEETCETLDKPEVIKSNTCSNTIRNLPDNTKYIQNTPESAVIIDNLSNKNNANAVGSGVKQNCKTFIKKNILLVSKKQEGKSPKESKNPSKVKFYNSSTRMSLPTLFHLTSNTLNQSKVSTPNNKLKTNNKKLISRSPNRSNSYVKLTKEDKQSPININLNQSHLSLSPTNINYPGSKANTTTNTPRLIPANNLKASQHNINIPYTQTNNMKKSPSCSPLKVGNLKATINNLLATNKTKDKTPKIKKNSQDKLIIKKQNKVMGVSEGIADQSFKSNKAANGFSNYKVKPKPSITAKSHYFDPSTKETATSDNHLIEAKTAILGSGVAANMKKNQTKRQKNQSYSYIDLNKENSFNFDDYEYHDHPNPFEKSISVQEPFNNSDSKMLLKSLTNKGYMGLNDKHTKTTMHKYTESSPFLMNYNLKSNQDNNLGWSLDDYGDDNLFENNLMKKNIHKATNAEPKFFCIDEKKQDYIDQSYLGEVSHMQNYKHPAKAYNKDNIKNLRYYNDTNKALISNTDYHQMISKTMKINKNKDYASKEFEFAEEESYEMDEEYRLAQKSTGVSFNLSNRLLPTETSLINNQQLQGQDQFPIASNESSNGDLLERKEIYCNCPITGVGCVSFSNNVFDVEASSTYLGYTSIRSFADLNK